MFYSHQLLSRKGPFGQIWIAATMHAKINRKRADQIDIEESCMQIINPIVPLALRLSGILMGGIVRIYHHKVKFLYDDVTEFLLKIKTMSTTNTIDTTTLPQGRAHAKFEAITIDGSDDVYNDVEHAVVQPDTPDQDEEFFVIPPSGRAPPSPLFNKCQAVNEDITLEEVDVRSYSSRLNELEREENEDRILPPHTFIGDDNLMDIPLHDAIQVSPKVREPIVEEHAQNTEGRDQVFEAQAPRSPEPENPPKRRQPWKRHAKKLVIDEQMTEIPAQVFNSWLQDASSIIYRKDRRKLYTGAQSERSKAMLTYPATFLSCGATGSPESFWPASLMELWKMNLSGRQNTSEELREKGKMPLQAEEEKNLEQRKKRVEEQGQTFRANLVHGIPEDFPPPLEFEEPRDFQDYGSVERLRTALRTPNAGSEEDFLGNQLGFTPVFSGQSAMPSKRRRSSQSDKLVLDSEGEYPTTARSKRSRLSERKSVSPLGIDVCGKEFLPDIGTPGLSVRIPWEPEGIPPASSQYDAESFEPSQARNPRDNIDKVTTILLKCLREHFNVPGAQEQSLNELTEGLEACQAAKLFFQICGTVLASNRYLTVIQKEAYGDIVIGRGDYL